MSLILAVGEVVDGKLDTACGELVAAGRAISADLDAEVAVVVMTAPSCELSADVRCLDADRLYTVKDPLLAKPNIDLYVSALQQISRQLKPSVILISKTPMGRDLGPKLAYRLGVGIAQDSMEVSSNSATGRITAVRPVYGGNALAQVTFSDVDPQIVVLRPKAYEVSLIKTPPIDQVDEMDVELHESMVKSRLVETINQPVEGVRLEDATVVVSGGRGLGGPEPFADLRDLAKLLGGAIGASRAVCDAGWLDHSFQVGLTGKTISPRLYITVGISGASQHMAGCSSARHLIAINRDKDANIFKSASYGVVGDWKNVLPSFIETVRELVNS